MRYQKTLVLILAICLLCFQGCLFTGNKNQSPGQNALMAYTVTAEGLNTLKKQVMARCQSGEMKPNDCQEMKYKYNRAVVVFHEAEAMAARINNTSNEADVAADQRKYDNTMAQLDTLLVIVDSFLQE